MLLYYLIMAFLSLRSYLITHTCMRGTANVSLEFPILMFFWCLTRRSYQLYPFGKLSISLPELQICIVRCTSCHCLVFQRLSAEKDTKSSLTTYSILLLLMFTPLIAVCGLKLTKICLLCLVKQLTRHRATFTYN